MSIDTAAERAKLAALEGHTPGPWRATLLDSDLNKEAALRRGTIKKGEYFGYAVCPDPWDGLSIALMPACDADHSEDAELVAAAPDLKASLATALDEIDRLRGTLEAARLCLDFMAAGDDEAAGMAKLAISAMDRAALRSTETSHDD